MTSDTQPRCNFALASRISEDDAEQLSEVIRVIASAFKRVPISLSIINNKDGNIYSNSHLPSLDRSYRHFEGQVKNHAACGSLILQVADFSAIAIWDTPDCTEAEDPASDNPLVQEYVEKCNRAQQKHLLDPKSTDGKLRPCYHLQFLARDPSKSPRSGLISALMLPVIERARKEGVDVWLEAANEHSLRIYEHYGFRTVEEMVIGKGQYDSDGHSQSDGEGFRVWAMLYDV